VILPNLAQPYNLRSAVFALLLEHTHRLRASCVMIDSVVDLVNEMLHRL